MLGTYCTQFLQARSLVTRITCVMRNVTGPKDQGTVMPRFLVTSALGAHSISVKSECDERDNVTGNMDSV